MNNIEHYKSLISDEEVIKALIKESKAREGELLKEKTRVRPNLNFFQRTVSNLVSSNKRVVATKELEYKEAQKPTFKARSKLKTPKEIVTSNITFVKASDSKTVKCDVDSEILSVREWSDSVKPCNSLSAVEKSYKDSLDKYFVRETDNNSNSGMAQTRNSLLSGNMSKSKSIVFNLNINKDRLISPITARKEFSRSDNRIEVISDVICVSDSSSSSDSEVIRISESDSD